MSKEDYYSVLNVSKEASDSDIKKAYRKLAMKYHPDRNAGNISAEEKFKVINEAYEILSDSQKRNAYDLHGHAGVDPLAANSAANENMDFGDIFGDVFGDIFGKNQEQKGKQRGSDLQYNLKLSLEDAMRSAWKWEQYIRK